MIDHAGRVRRYQAAARAVEVVVIKRDHRSGGEVCVARVVSRWIGNAVRRSRHESTAAGGRRQPELQQTGGVSRTRSPRAERFPFRSEDRQPVRRDRADQRHCAGEHEDNCEGARCVGERAPYLGRNHLRNTEREGDRGVARAEVLRPVFVRRRSWQ